jgi:hypothetical protein
MDTNSAASLNSRIAAIVDQLASATDAARAAETMTHYLEFAAQFHRYSWGNQMLIGLGHPDATQVAGYKTWQAMRRQVRKGERGIAILAPIAYRLKDAAGEPTPETRLTFKTVYVFDVSQTEGEPLPDAPEWKSPEQDAELTARLMAFARANGITVMVEDLPGEVQGQSRGGTIALSPKAGTKTLIHELAHELLHKSTLAILVMSRDLKELQAESVAYVVARHFGLEPAGSPNYLALWGAQGKDVRATLSTIQHCAAQIIGAVEGQAPEGQA